jgi:hypothetical protein
MFYFCANWRIPEAEYQLRFAQKNAIMNTTSDLINGMGWVSIVAGLIAGTSLSLSRVELSASSLIEHTLGSLSMVACAAASASGFTNAYMIYLMDKKKATNNCMLFFFNQQMTHMRTHMTRMLYFASFVELTLLAIIACDRALWFAYKWSADSQMVDIIVSHVALVAIAGILAYVVRNFRSALSMHNNCVLLHNHQFLYLLAATPEKLCKLTHLDKHVHRSERLLFTDTSSRTQLTNRTSKAIL